MGHAVLLRVALGRVLLVHDEGSQEATPGLVACVVVGVVHQRAVRRGRELIRVGLARRNRLLGDERDAVLEEVLERDAMEMDTGRLLEVVREDRLDLVALRHAQLGAGPDLVVAERLERCLDASILWSISSMVSSKTFTPLTTFGLISAFPCVTWANSGTAASSG